jgi:hypothetical protein
MRLLCVALSKNISYFQYFNILNNYRTYNYQKGFSCSYLNTLRIQASSSLVSVLIECLSLLLFPWIQFSDSLKIKGKVYLYDCSVATYEFKLANLNSISPIFLSFSALSAFKLFMLFCFSLSDYSRFLISAVKFLPFWFDDSDNYLCRSIFCVLRSSMCMFIIFIFFSY